MSRNPSKRIDTPSADGPGGELGFSATDTKTGRRLPGFSAPGRRLPLPTFPEIPRGDDTPHGPEITAIASVLWCAFHHCKNAATEHQAGNHFLVLVHGKLHKRLHDLRAEFLQRAHAAGISYTEAAVPFDNLASALAQMKIVATHVLFQQNGKRRTDKATKKMIAWGEAEYFNNVVRVNGLLEFLATSTGPKPDGTNEVNHDDAKQRMERAINETTNGKTAKAGILIAKAKINRAEGLAALRTLKEQGKYDGP